MSQSTFKCLERHQTPTFRRYGGSCTLPVTAFYPSPLLLVHFERNQSNEICVGSRRRQDLSRRNAAKTSRFALKTAVASLQLGFGPADGPSRLGGRQRAVGVLQVLCRRGWYRVRRRICERLPGLVATVNHTAVEHGPAEDRLDGAVRVLHEA